MPLWVPRNVRLVLGRCGRSGVTTFRAVARQAATAGLGGGRRKKLLYPGVTGVLGTRQEIAAFTRSATFFSTMGLHL